MTWRDDAISDIHAAESCRLVAYLDGEGVWTIGWGHTAGVQSGDTCTQEQADAWFAADVDVAERDLYAHVPWFRASPDAVKRGLLSMSFNLGWPRLSGFKAMLLAGSMADWQGMADEALQSKWATQVPTRAIFIANLFRSATVGVA